MKASRHLIFRSGRGRPGRRLHRPTWNQAPDNDAYAGFDQLFSHADYDFKDPFRQPGELRSVWGAGVSEVVFYAVPRALHAGTVGSRPVWVCWPAPWPSSKLSFGAKPESPKACWGRPRKSS